MTAEHRQARRLGNPVRVRSLSVAVYIGVCVHGVIRSLGKPGKAEHKRRGCHTAPHDVSQNTDDVGTQKEPLPVGVSFWTLCCEKIGRTKPFGLVRFSFPRLNRAAPRGASEYIVRKQKQPLFHQLLWEVKQMEKVTNQREEETVNEQERHIIQLMRELGYGQLIVSIKNGKPVHVETRKSISLNP